VPNPIATAVPMFTLGNCESRAGPHALSDLTLSGGNQAEPLATTEESLDRVNGMVENLLDMIRLQAGALAIRDVADVISADVTSLGPAASEMIIRVPEKLPEAAANPALLSTRAEPSSHRDQRERRHGASDHLPAETAVERP
jgi:two-component system, OmpR family, sensor histidine kinase KdpD